MALQVCPDKKELLTEAIERVVRSRTGGCIRGLQIDRNGEEVVIYGKTDTYYNKQLVTHAALDAMDDMRLFNEIEVCL